MALDEDGSAAERPLLEVLDRVLSRGIVITYDGDVSVAGLRVVGASGHVTIMSLETCTTMTAPLGDGEITAAIVTAVEEYLHDLPHGDAPHL